MLYSNEPLIILQRSINRFIADDIVRYLWTNKFKKTNIKYEPSNGCARPERPPECPSVYVRRTSKCLEKDEKPKKRFWIFRKEKSKDVKKEKPKGRKLTLWESIFGVDPKKVIPEGCTCRQDYYKQRERLAENPRLCDPLFQSTRGDILIYTIPMKKGKRSDKEIAPKPPPAPKIPKAAMFKIISGTVNKEYFETALSMWRRGNCTDECNSKAVYLRPYTIPYEEMRPPEKRRDPTTCKDGIKSKDVIQPFNKDLSPYGLPYKIPHHADETLQKDYETDAKEEIENVVEQKPVQRSRIEQLKLLVEGSTKRKIKCKRLSAS